MVERTPKTADQRSRDEIKIIFLTALEAATDYNNLPLDSIADALVDNVAGVEEKSTDQNRVGSKEQVAREQAMKLESQVRLLGLGFEFRKPFGSPGSVIVRGEEIPTQEDTAFLICLVVMEDAPKFLEFLKKMDAQDISGNDRKSRSNINWFFDIFIKQLGESYHSGQALEDRWMGLIRYAKEFSQEFLRLGMDDTARCIELYATSHEQGALAEFCWLQRLRAFDSLKGYIDTTSDEYRAKWEELFVAANTCRHNERAVLLVGQALENLMQRADYAIKDIEQMIASGDETNHYVRVVLPQLLQVAMEYKQKMSALLTTLSQKPTGAHYD